jgi:adenylate kinase family enzyme
MGTAVILSGPPGTGKSSIAKEVSKLLDDAAIVEVDEFKKRNHGGTTTVSAEKDFLEAGKMAATEINDHQYVLIVEAFFVPSLLDKVLAQLPEQTRVEKFLLWCDEGTAVRRATEREVDRLAESDVRNVYRCFSKTYADRVTVDTQVNTLDQSAREILDRLTGQH